MHKTHPESFVFEILFIGEYSSAFWEMAKVNVYNMFSF